MHVTLNPHLINAYRLGIRTNSFCNVYRHSGRSPVERGEMPKLICSVPKKQPARSAFPMHEVFEQRCDQEQQYPGAERAPDEKPIQGNA